MGPTVPVPVPVPGLESGTGTGTGKGTGTGTGDDFGGPKVSISVRWERVFLPSAPESDR